MPQTTTDLGKLVKSKYPGQYDDLPDQEVGVRVKTKFPGSYDDFQDEKDTPQSGNWATRGLISPQRITRALAGKDVAGQIEGRRLGEALPGENPSQAYWRTMREGVTKSGAETLSSLTSPVSLATAGLGAAGRIPGAVGTLAKAAGGATGLGFLGYGTEQATAPRRPEETTADVTERRLQGGAMMAGGTAGSMAGAPAMGGINRLRLGVRRAEKQALMYPDEMTGISPRAASGLERVKRVAAPTGTNTSFDPNLRQVKGRLAEIGREIEASPVPLKKVRGGILTEDKRFSRVIQAFDDYLKGMREKELRPQIDPHADNQVKVTWGADARAGLESLANTAGKAEVRALATDMLERNIATIGELDKLRMVANQELLGFEKKTASGQVTAEMTNKGLEGYKSLDRQVGNIISDELFQRGEPGIREYERDYAGLMDIRRQLASRQNLSELDRGLHNAPLFHWLTRFTSSQPSFAGASQSAVADVPLGRTLERGLRNLSRSELTANPQGRWNPWPVDPANRLLPAPGETVPVENYATQVPEQMRRFRRLLPEGEPTPQFTEATNKGMRVTRGIRQQGGGTPNVRAVKLPGRELGPRQTIPQSRRSGPLPTGDNLTVLQRRYLTSIGYPEEALNGLTPAEIAGLVSQSSAK